MRNWLPFAVLSLLGAGCSSAGGPYPSLQPRAAEAIDPRVPITRAVNDRPAKRELDQRLSTLLAQAKSGDVEFDSLAQAAERLAKAAGSRQSESWVVAQEALTAAIAARRPTATALGDIDEIAANALEAQGGLAPNDLRSIDRTAEEVSSIDQQQARRIATIQAALNR